MAQQEEAGPQGRTMPGNRRRGPVLGLRLHLLLLSLALLVPALLAGGLTAWQLGGAYRRASEAGLRGTARAMAAAVDQQLTTAVTAATTLAGSLDRLPGDPSELAGFYAQARAVGEAMGGWVVLAHGDGKQILNTLQPLGRTLPEARGQPWIARAVETGRAVLSDRLFFGGVAQRPVLAVFAPLRVPEKPGAVVILAFDPNWLATLLARIRDGQVAGLIELRSGSLVARSVGHETHIGQQAPPWMATALAGQEEGLAEISLIEGPGAVAAFQRLESVPWMAYVTVPLDAYEEAWQLPLVRLALGSTLLLLAALLLAGWRARRFLAPLDALTAEARALAAGQAASSGTAPFAIAELETLRQALAQSGQAMRARAMAEGRAAAALEMMTALRNERDRAQRYFDAAGTMLLVLNPDGTAQGINRHGLEVIGVPDEADVLGQDWIAAFVAPRWQVRVRAGFQALVEGAQDPPPQSEVVPLIRADGEERQVAWRSTVLRDPQGRFLALLASGDDITEQRASEERQVLLMQEVDHRAKNALALVQSIIRLTRADHPADFADAVEGRVGALARAYTLLARERWAGSDLRELAEAELAAYAPEERVTLSGPSVRLAPEVVQPMAMVLYELASNAARHGALSNPRGRVTLAWERMADGALRLEWSEQGGPLLPGGDPPRRGFGSRMIKVAVAGQLGGTLAFDWRPSGLACTLTVAADRVSIRQGGFLQAPGRGPGPAGEASAATVLRGRHVLLAEDEALVALELAETLAELGCVVAGPAATLAEALRLAEQEPLDAAVLDVNLRGQAAFPAADMLVRRGVPVLFVTGYGEMPGGWAVGGGQGRTALLRKPLAQGALGVALRRLLDEAAPQSPATRKAARGGLPPSQRFNGRG